MDAAAVAYTKQHGRFQLRDWILLIKTSHVGLLQWLSWWLSAHIYHGLYGSTSCCKPWAKSMTERDFRPSTARRPLDRFSWNLKYITTSRTRPRMQNFRGLRRHGWSGQIASLTHESFCPFFRFFATPTGRIFGHIPTISTSLCVVPAKEVLFGGQKD